MERVQKILGNYGVCSRRKAENLIKDNTVKINNKLATLGDKADIKHDKIEVDLTPLKNKKIKQLKKREELGGCRIKHDKAIISPETAEKTLVYIALNKPTLPPRIYPAGRLDKDSQGLVLLTNDGNLTEKITHPRYEHKKVYQVWINKKLVDNDKKKLNTGFELKDRRKEKVQGIKIKNLKNTHKGQKLTISFN